MDSLLIAPHNDDETLFCSHAISRHNADVLIIFDSLVQFERGDLACTTDARRLESLRAINYLRVGMESLEERTFFLGFLDTFDPTGAFLSQAIASRVLILGKSYDQVFLPMWEKGGHHHHNLVHDAAAFAFGILRKRTLGMTARAILYSTYTPNGKTLLPGHDVKLTGEELRRKLRALAFYKTQIDRDDCRPHFERSQEEYVI